MAAVNKFKNWMAAKLSAILRKEIAPSEITLSPVRAASGARSSLVEVTYGGVAYPIVYDKYPINALFGSAATAPSAIAGQFTDVLEALPLLNARYGLELRPEDVKSAPVDKQMANLTFEILPACYEYSGKLIVPYAYNGPIELETPQHEWLLQKNLANTGKSAVALPDKFTFANNAQGDWGQVTTLAHIPFGADGQLNRPGDYTLDLEIMVPAVPTYICLLSTSPSVAGATGSIWWYGGTCYEYGVSAGQAKITPMKPNLPFRLTLVRTGGKTSMYINGVFEQEYVGGNNSPWVGIHDGDSPSYQFSASNFIRKIRFWQRALSAQELPNLFKK